MSTNHFHVLAKAESWVVTLNGLYFKTCDSQLDSCHEALAKARELGSGEIYVHDRDGELAWHESVPRGQDVD